MSFSLILAKTTLGLPTDARQHHQKAIDRGAECWRCPLKNGGRGPVMGQVVPNAPLAFVGEAPGKLEIEEGKPFVGASGVILNEAIERGGGKRSMCTVTNTILCQPPVGQSLQDYLKELKLQHKIASDRYTAAKKRGDTSVSPPPVLVLPTEACFPRLRKDLAESNSRTTCAVGGEAVRQLAKHFEIPYGTQKSPPGTPRLATIKKQHGSPVVLPDGRIIMTSLHPAFAMRGSTEYMPVIKEDLARAVRIALRGHIDWQEPEFILNPTPDAAVNVMETMRRSGARVTVDIETDDKIVRVAKIRCVGLGAVIDGREIVIVVPLLHMNRRNWWMPGVETRVVSALRALLNEAPLAGQNLAFDTAILLRDGLMGDRTKLWFDTMLAANNSSHSELPKDLGFLTAREFEAPRWKEDADSKSVDGVDDHTLHGYNARDILGTMRLVAPMVNRVNDSLMVGSFLVDTQLAPIARDMGDLGLNLNETVRRDIYGKLDKVAQDRRTRVREIVGRTEFNPNSFRQVARWLFVDQKLTPAYDTEGKEWGAKKPYDEDAEEEDKALTEDEMLIKASTNEQSLLRLLDQGVPDNVKSFIDALLMYRGMEKIKGTYIGYKWDDDTEQLRDVFRERKVVMDEWRASLGKKLTILRTSWKLHVVPSGRWSSSLQTFPERIVWDVPSYQATKDLKGQEPQGIINTRSMMEAPEGYILVGADYNAIELWLYAIQAKDELLLNARQTKCPVTGKIGLDPHSYNYACMMGGTDPAQIARWYTQVMKSPDQIKKYCRNIAKRFCIAEDELVLTDRGLVPIQDVAGCDLVWDGIEWVSHEGVIYQGDKEVIEYDGLRATPDHEVWVKDGRKIQLGQAAAEGCLLARTGAGRSPLRVVARRCGAVRVYDLLNAGPRRRFTVSGCLVSNCFLIIYGGQRDKLYKTMVSDRNPDGTRSFPDLTPEQVFYWFDNWHHTHPWTRIWQSRVVEAWRQYGYVGSIIDRRKRYFLGGIDVTAMPNMAIQSCQPKDARVLTDSGYRQMGDLLGKEQGVKAWTGTRWADFKVLQMGGDERVEVKLSNGKKLSCDTRHKVLVPGANGYKWRCLVDLPPGTEIAVHLAQPMEYGSGLDEEDAYWLGYYYGNGHIDGRPGHDGGHSVAVTIGERKHLPRQVQVDRLCDYLQRRKLTVWKPRIHAGSTTIYAGGKVAVAFFAGRGATPNETAHTKRVPATVWSASLVARKAFLRGFLDADGYIDDAERKTRVTMNLCNEALCDDLFLLGHTVGLDGSLHGPYAADKKGHTSYRLTWYRGLVYSALGVGAPAYLRGAGPPAQAFEMTGLAAAPRSMFKRKSSGEVLRDRAIHGGRVGVYQMQKMGFAPDFSTAKVVSVERTDKHEPMYTLDVDAEEHRYVGESVVAKNSAASIINRALIAIAKECPHRGWGELAGPILQIHDFLALQVPLARQKDAEALLAEYMPYTYEGITLGIEGKSHKTWAKV